MLYNIHALVEMRRILIHSSVFSNCMYMYLHCNELIIIKNKYLFLACWDPGPLSYEKHTRPSNSHTSVAVILMNI